MNIYTVYLRLVILTTILQVLMASQNDLTLSSNNQGIRISTNDFIRNQQGMISSYDLRQTSKHLKIIWSFALPEDVLFTIYAKKLSFQFEVNQNCPSCCPENALYLPNNFKGLQVVCANNIFQTLTTLETNFLIAFVSQFAQQGVQLGFSIRKRTIACSKSSFQCFDKKGCYSIDKICDGEFDCEDHTDEQNCLRCRTNYTICNNHDWTLMGHKNCFHPEFHRCDGILHCPSGEDELNCVPHCRSKISCADKSGCYSLDQRCDGEFNCEDHSDEANCRSIKCEILSNTSNYFACQNGWCIKSSKLHDGIVDCDDSSDESPFTMNMLVTLLIIYILLVVLTLCIGIFWCFGLCVECKQKKIGRKLSLLNYYKRVRCRRDAASQLSEPILLSRRCYLKPSPSTSTNSSSFGCESLLYEAIDSSLDSEEIVSTISRSYEEMDSQYLNDFHHAVNPSVAENFPQVHASDLKIVKTKIYDNSEKVPKTLHRLQTFEICI